MAVKIRLMRMGKKKQPSYRVVVADARSPRDGRIIERIGTYAPRQDPSLVEIDADKAVDWLKKGAQPTEQVQKIFETSGVWDRFQAERPGAITAAKKKVESHKTALANRPAPEPEPEPAPEPEASAEEPAAEEPAAEEPAAEEPAAEEPAAEEPAAEEPAAEPEPAADETTEDEA